MSLWKILRLGLRQFAAGMLSVLVLGVLNRVMKIEMGLELGLVSLALSAQYFAAPLAVPLGHRSDRRPYFGLHRTPYIAAGAAVTALTTALAPFVAFFVVGQRGSLVSTTVGVGFFLLMGAGMYTAGTAYLSLIADLTDEAERGKVVCIIWSMLMFGILGGVFLTVKVMGDYTPDRLIALFLIMAGIIALFTLVAVWGQERQARARPSAEVINLGQAVKVLTSGRQTRFFFGFLFSGIFFLFLQQATLEPFGGDVFGMSVRETTLFNAFQMVGVLLGMGAAGAWLAKRWGIHATAGLGLTLAIVSFGMLAAASASMQASLVRPAIFLMGLGMGVYTVGGLSLMMNMTAAGRVGLYMGAWTLAEATARGLSAAGGGAIHDLALALFGREASAHAMVFCIEAVGLAGAILLISRISTSAFRREVAQVSAKTSSAS